MKRSFMFPVFILLSCLAVGSCADLNPEVTEFGPLARDSIVLEDSIPAEYGKLISVTTTEVYPGWAQLWFQKEDQTIVTVFLRFSTGHLKENALLIPRS